MVCVLKKHTMKFGGITNTSLWFVPGCPAELSRQVPNVFCFSLPLIAWETSSPEVIKYTQQSLFQEYNEGLWLQSHSICQLVILQINKFSCVQPSPCVVMRVMPICYWNGCIFKHICSHLSVLVIWFEMILIFWISAQTKQIAILCCATSGAKKLHYTF